MEKEEEEEQEKKKKKNAEADDVEEEDTVKVIVGPSDRLQTSSTCCLKFCRDIAVVLCLCSWAV